MPTNATPEYKAAEAAYRRARDPQERLAHLREMLRAIPKHKGTEHLQAEIKSRIKELSEAQKSPHTGTHGGPELVVRREGAAQVALVGPPNSGKSSLHHALTGSHVAVGDFPFTTKHPAPGMVERRDAQIQLVDLPPISAGHEIPWIGNALQPADAVLLVVDVTRPGCVEEVFTVHDVLATRRIRLTADWEGRNGDDDDPFTVVLPTVLVAAKSDLSGDADAELEVLEELAGVDYPVLHASARTGDGLDDLVGWLFDHLGIIRVRTKVPGQRADQGKPYTVRLGATVLDVAELVHRDLARELRYARVWGPGHDGRRVGRDHIVADGDVIELHA